MIKGDIFFERKGNERKTEFIIHKCYESGLLKKKDLALLLRRARSGEKININMKLGDDVFRSHMDVVKRRMNTLSRKDLVPYDFDISLILDAKYVNFIGFENVNFSRMMGELIMPIYKFNTGFKYWYYIKEFGFFQNWDEL